MVKEHRMEEGTQTYIVQPFVHRTCNLFANLLKQTFLILQKCFHERHQVGGGTGTPIALKHFY